MSAQVCEMSQEQERVVSAATEVGRVLERRKLTYSEALDALLLVIGFAIDQGAADREESLAYVQHMLSGCVHVEDEEDESLADIPDEEFFRA